MIVVMNIILIVYAVFLVVWILGVVASGYHVFSYRFPKDKTVPAFTAYLIVSAIVLVLSFNWFLSVYFGG